MILINIITLVIISLVATYFTVLFVWLVPSIGISVREVKITRSHIRKELVNRFQNITIEAKSADILISMEKLQIPLRRLSVTKASIFCYAISGDNYNKHFSFISEERNKKLSILLNDISNDIQNTSSIGKMYRRIRRKFFLYIFKSHFWGIKYFSQNILPKFLDRCGRYITITAMLAVLAGFYIWIARGENRIDSADSLILLNITILSYAALISACFAVIIELLIQLRNLWGIEDGSKYFTTTLVIAISATLIFVSISAFLQYDYINFIKSFYNLLNLKNFDTYIVQIIFACGSYGVVRHTVQLWKRQFFPVSWKLAWLAGSLWICTMAIMMIVDISKINYISSLLSIILFILCYAISLVAIILRNFEIYSDSRKYNFNAGISGFFSILSTLFFIALIIFLNAKYRYIKYLEEKINSECLSFSDKFSNGLSCGDVMNELTLNIIIYFLGGAFLAMFLLILIIVFQFIFISRNNKRRNYILSIPINLNMNAFSCKKWLTDEVQKLL